MGNKAFKLTVPPNSHHFAVYRIRSERRRNAETGALVSHAKYERCMGEAQQDGTVPEVWPIAELSAAKLLEQWGSGRYRIDFFSADGDQLKGRGHTIEVAEPAAKGPKLAKARARTVQREEGAAEPATERLPETMTAWDVMNLIDQREQRAAERAAREYEQRAERDRQFMQQMAGMFQGSGAASSGASIDLLKRELTLTFEKQMFALQQQLADRGNEEPEEEPEDPEDGPKDMNEAGERIGLAILKEIEERAPELVQEMIPNVVGFLQRKGFVPSEGLQARIRDLKNGAGNANGR